jgi:hypothetical protein
MCIFPRHSSSSVLICISAHWLTADIMHVMRRDRFYAETMPQGTVYRQFGTFRPQNTFPLEIINFTHLISPCETLTFSMVILWKEHILNPVRIRTKKLQKYLNSFHTIFRDASRHGWIGCSAQGNYCEEGNWEVLKFWMKYSQVNKQNKKRTPWSESANELYRPSDRRFSAKWLPTFADKGCHVVSVTDLYGRILGFLYRSRYFSIK